MTWLLIAGLLFGLVHPGCKLLTSDGLPLLPFCLLFVVFRVVFQLPVVWRSGGVRVTSAIQWKLLIALGLVGALLRITEFLGIVNGLPVSLVAFLIYLHPVWTILFSRYLNGERLTGLRIFKIVAALLGTSLLVDLSSVHHVDHLPHLWSPIAAGILISLWICLSTRAQKEGAQVVSVAFFYDVFTLVPLLLLAPIMMDAQDWATTWTWIAAPRNIALLSAYTLLTGVFPNYAFYYGLKKATPIAAALLMLFEPIASTLIGVTAWDERIGTSFYWGALLILMINLPDLMLENLFKRWLRPGYKMPMTPTAGKIVLDRPAPLRQRD